MANTPEIRTTQADILVVYGGNTDTERVTQAYALAAINLPTGFERTTQVYANVAGTTSPDVRVTQQYVLVAIKQGADQRMIRAWTFTQDDHDFYVLSLGSQTLVYDKLTDQWAQWLNSDAVYWRGIDGCDWEGWNVCIDPDSGKIFKIDPDNRLDYTTTPIVSQVFGGMTERFRNYTPCYMAEVAISQARPPAGLADPTTVGIRLRTYDTVTWTDHGTLQGQATGNMLYARFYGLGLLKSPGCLFEITDYGYARRIDGLNVEMAGNPDGQ